jgi:hypothetical protein
MGTHNTGRRQSRDTGNIGHTRHRTKTNKTRTTTQNTNKMSNKDPIKILKYQVLAKGKQFVLFIRHPPC